MELPDDVPYRIMFKKDLGGVIFGCNQDQITEFEEKQLLGLLLPDFIYLMKFKPALPLFLFNYSDKKLYGIFERADPPTDENKHQQLVRIRPQQQYHPLPRSQLELIIDDYYFDINCPYFELGHHETKNLLNLFKGTPSDVQSLSISEQQPVKFVSKISERESVESLTRRMKRAKELGQDLIWDEDGWRMRNYVY
ncbi:B2 protein [Linum grandiflorum]